MVLGNLWEPAVSPVNTTQACKSFVGISVTLHEAMGRSDMETAGSFTKETWLEQYFSAMETFSADGDDVLSGSS